MKFTSISNTVCLQIETMEISRGMILLPLLLACFFSALTMATAAAAKTVKVSATLIFPEIPWGQATKDFQVLLRVEAPAAAHPEARAPIDVVAVLDVSGSMNDPAAASSAPEKRLSRLDVLKAAAKFMVAKLGDGDRVSVVAFNDRPVKELSSGLQYMSGDGRRNAMRAVDQLEARGSTALMPALEEAVKILDGRLGDGRSRLGFIVVLTDGEHTSGFTWRELRHETIRDALSRYPVHTLGLGTAHGPEVLLYLAQESHGTYSFVDDGNLGKIPGALAVCLGGLTTVAAVDTRVVLKAPELSGVRIDRVDSGGHDSFVGCGGAACEVAVGVLYAGEAKNFVVHLNVPAAPPPPSSVECGCGLSVCDKQHHRSESNKQHLLAVGYSYIHSNQYHLGAPAITVEGHGVFIQRSPELGGSRRRRQALLPSPVVLQHIVRFELLEVVSGLIHGGKLMIKDRARAGELLQLKWEEFRACHQFWGGLDLSGLEKEMEAMVSSLEAGAVAYVYAWVSSHQMQRATSLGSPEKAVAEFLTPAMRLMLEEAQRLPLQAQTAAAATANVEHTTVGCADCVHMQMIDRRLELWSKVKRDVKHLMLRPLAAAAADGEDEHLAAVFLEASLEAIHRAMHRDIYLAAVYASKQSRCHSGTGK